MKVLQINMKTEQGSSRGTSVESRGTLISLSFCRGIFPGGVGKGEKSGCCGR